MSARSIFLLALAVLTLFAMWIGGTLPRTFGEWLGLGLFCCIAGFAIDCVTNPSRSS